jgi:hypothetical protein
MKPPEKMLYNSAIVETIIWTDHGFTPYRDIHETAVNLAHDLKNLDLLSNIYKELDIVETKQTQTKIVYDDSMGFQHISLGDIRDISLKSPIIESLSSRIYVSNAELNMKCKIAVRSVTKANLNLNSSDIVKFLPLIYLKNESVCRLIYRNIPSKFNLGGINYAGHISAIETSDSSIGSIINSTYNAITERFEINGNPLSPEVAQKVIESYKALMSGASQGDEDISIIDKMKRYNVKKSKIIIHHSHEDIQACILNFKLLEGDLIDRVPHRIISCLTVPHAGIALIRNLAYDYLSIT